MAEAREYVLVVEKDKLRAEQIAEEVAQKLQNRETTLIDLVKSVGEYINNDDPTIKARAVRFLAAIVGALPDTYLSRQQIQVLCDFFCARMEDRGALEGLSKLQTLDRFTNVMAQTVVRALFEHFVDLQQRTVSARFQVLSFLNDIMTRHRKACQLLGDDFVVGITDFVAGEKDPRNLMLIFSMLRVVMLEWDVTNHVGTLFDSVYTYFPITYRPPANDPFNITPQDLKDRLRECLSCSSLMATYAMPCLLDKVDTQSNNTKRDVMQTIASCAKHYEPNVMSQYSIPLWDALKYEVLSAEEPELADEALVALQSIAICLSRSKNTSPTSSPLILYLRPITKESMDHLKQPAQRQAKASGDILQAVSAASEAAFTYVIRTVMAPLQAVYQSSEGILQQRAVLEIVNQFFESSIIVFGSWTVKSAQGSDPASNPLAEFKDQFSAIYGQALMGTVKEEVSFRLSAAKGLLLLSKMRAYLQDNEIGLFVQYFNDVVLGNESYGRDELKSTAIAGLAEISNFKPSLISDISFPAFMARLPDSEADAAASVSYQSTLEGLAEISTQKDLVETLIRRLLNRLDILFKSDRQGPFPYTCALLLTVLRVFKRSADSSPDSRVLDTYYDRVVVGLSISIHNVNRSASQGPLGNEVVLDLLGRIDNLIIRNAAPIRLDAVAANVYDLFSAGPDAELSAPVLPEPSSGSNQVISTWMLAALPRDLQVLLFEKESMDRTLSQLINLTRTCSEHVVRIACLRQLALFVNKHYKNSDLQHVHHTIKDLFGSLSTTKAQTFTDWDLRILFALAKALVLRLAPSTNEVLAGLVTLIDPVQCPGGVSRVAASLFSNLLAPDDVLSKEHLAQIRLLAPQRMFQVLTPLIAERFRKSSSPDEKQNCLTALSGVVCTVPSEIVMPELPTLLPLLLQSLDISDESVKIATLETIAVVISNNPSSLEESGHIPALVRRLLTVASIPRPTAKTTPTSTRLPRTRKLAARCLRLLPTHLGDTSTVNPLLALKRDVLQKSMVLLDDPRRDVRKEVVDARNAWLREVDDLPDDDDD